MSRTKYSLISIAFGGFIGLVIAEILQEYVNYGIELIGVLDTIMISGIAGGIVGATTKGKSAEYVFIVAGQILGLMLYLYLLIFASIDRHLTLLEVWILGGVLGGIGSWLLRLNKRYEDAGVAIVVGMMVGFPVGWLGAVFGYILTSSEYIAAIAYIIVWILVARISGSKLLVKLNTFWKSSIIAGASVILSAIDGTLTLIIVGHGLGLNINNIPRFFEQKSFGIPLFVLILMVIGYVTYYSVMLVRKKKELGRIKKGVLDKIYEVTKTCGD